MVRLRSILVGVLLSAGAAADAAEIPIPAAPAAPSFVLPKPVGSYSVGVRAFAWIDGSREEVATPDPGDYREVAIQIWYPAKSSTKAPGVAYTPELEEMLAAAVQMPKAYQDFINLHAPMRGAASTSVAGVRIASSEEPWPVILYSPGGNISRHWQTALAERLASQGFIFVSMSHPYSTMDVAPKSGFSMNIDWGLGQEDKQKAAEAYVRLADILAGDVQFVLAKLDGLQNGGLFGEGLELERVGLIGHSRGAMTVARACSTEARIAVCAIIDNNVPEPLSRVSIDAPLLVLRSPWEGPAIAVLHEFLGRAGNVSFDLRLAGSNHFTCTDLPFFMPELRIEGVDPVEGVEACATILGNFFDHFLQGQVSPELPWAPGIGADKFLLKRF